MSNENQNTSPRLFLIFGDQLNFDSLLFQAVNPQHDRLLMAEVLEESNGLDSPSSQQRTVLFFSAMRHFRANLKAQGFQVDYTPITDHCPDFTTALSAQLSRHPFDHLKAVLPGDERVRTTVTQWAQHNAINIEWLADHHFITQPGEFQEWIKNKKQPRMEYWYRYLRKSRNILMEPDGKPLGGKWNYDASNRRAFGKQGPNRENLSSECDFNHEDDSIVQEVIHDVKSVLPDLAGKLTHFNWPVTRPQALQQLQWFVEQQLPHFGDYQDAMWEEQPFLHHSRLASSLNLKLLSPSEVITAAETAYHHYQLPLNAVEGFVRQILGWREYVRGLYWLHRSEWPHMNFLQAKRPLPKFYWSADTDMHCLQQSIQQVIKHGYGHHIQRLMVTGLFSLLYGVNPSEIERWYLSMFVDAVAWVEQPNTLAMSQFADGGLLASKPYIASGNYIHKMSNYCQTCPFNPKLAVGKQACPFTTLYWHFIQQHYTLLQNNPRLAMQVKHWDNKSSEEQHAINQQAQSLFKRLSVS